jgi:hypothetical protein
MQNLLKRFSGHEVLCRQARLKLPPIDCGPSHSANKQLVNCWPILKAVAIYALRRTARQGDSAGRHTPHTPLTTKPPSVNPPPIRPTSVPIGSARSSMTSPTTQPQGLASDIAPPNRVRRVDRNEVRIIDEELDFIDFRKTLLNCCCEFWINLTQSFFLFRAAISAAAVVAT